MKADEIALPSEWELAFVSKGAPVEGLRLSAMGSVSWALFRQGASALGEGLRSPFGKRRLELSELPTIDEAWALFMLAWMEAGRELPAAFEAMCRYTEDVRQGHWPDRVAPEQSVQALYLAIAQEHLLRRPPQRERFLHDAFVLFRTVAGRLAGGARLLDDPIAQGAHSLQRYSAMLASDRALYAEDLRRARRFWAKVPAQHSATGGVRRLPLLVLERPAATQFKLWARRDPAAPGGHGYPLLLTSVAGGSLVLSADPASKVQVGWLARPLTEAERAARPGSEGEGSEWYDGKDHSGTLAAAPVGGSRLSLSRALEVIHGPLSLERAGPPPRARYALGGAALLVVGAAAVLALTRGPTAEWLPPERGAKGEPVPKAKVLNLLGEPSGPRSFTHHALVAGACAYSGDRELRFPCRDARAVRELLVRHYGYEERNVMYAVDRPEPGERTDGAPTAANLRLLVERFRERFGEDERSSFLFFYSGHGGYEKGARKDFGVLQPTGYFERPELPMSDRGWDMQDLLDGVRKGVPSRHVLVVLDACYSGWAVGAKGDWGLRTELMSLWNERAEVVVTAGTKGQRAWEDEAEPSAWSWGGHSALTAFLLEGLTPSGGRAPADTSGDGVVTDEELALFLRRRVPESVRAVKRAEQLPQIFRFDEHLPRSGQFLFVPKG
ncbi:MAG: caspase family protein [Myxococcales bacterium]|nr:caspase family protein [Myxococcales bacterium]